jgi:lipoate synthase
MMRGEPGTVRSEWRVWGMNSDKRFEVLIKDTSFFDCLVGYFYSSGFHAIYHSLENTEKIRILIRISTSRQTFELLENAKKLKDS